MKSSTLENTPILEEDSNEPDASHLLEGGIGFRLSRITRNLRHTWSCRLKPLGISPPQAAIIRGLSNFSEISLRELARLLGADPMNVKRCVDDLESLQLVKSGTNEDDKRQRILTLTKCGQGLADKINQLAKVQEQWLRTAIPSDDLTPFLDALKSLEVLLAISSSTKVDNSAGQI
ncbi:MAG: winged helix-turn-helix transcriptional regulator [Acidimicrobiaceae bacterium]|nr:winged helix-turn-helix transcriptional regulator [Acidimicrobiaceae bacterium]